MVLQNKTECRYQESTQSSTTPDLGYLWESDNANESQEVSPFLAGDHMASTNRRALNHNKENRNNINDPQKKYRLGKIIEVNIATQFPMETTSFGSPWENLKKKLNEELTSEDLRNILFLLKDKLGSLFPVLWENDDPYALFTYLEENTSEHEAIEILKHVLGFLKYHPQFSEKSFAELIDDHAQKIREIEEKYEIYRDAYFIGRRDELEIMKTNLCSHCKGVWLCGQGGLGKTTLAHEACIRMSMYKNIEIVNVNVKGWKKASDVARQILMARKENSTETCEDSLISQAVTSVRKLGQAGYDAIVLLDSIEDVFEHDKERSTVLIKELCSILAPNVKLLLTSRLHIHEALDGSVADLFVLKLTPFSRKDASTLLTISSRPKRLTENDCDAILNFSGYSPLAIRLISRTIHIYSQEAITVHDMLDYVKGAATLEPVLNIIKYSYERLDKAAKETLLRISVFRNSNFTTDEVAFMTNNSMKDTILTMLLLKYRNLIEIEENISKKGGISLAYYFHPLVLNFLSNIKQPEDLEHCYAQLILKMVVNLEGTHNEKYDEAISVFRERVGSIAVLFGNIQANPSSFVVTRNSYLYKLSIFLGTPEERERVLYRVAIKHKQNGMKTSALYWTVQTAATCMDEIKTTEAENYLWEIQDSIENANPTSADLQYVHGEYYLTKGRIYHQKNKLHESEKFLLKAQECFMQSGQVQERFTELARTHNALGTVYYTRKNYSVAAMYHQNAYNLMNQYLFDRNNPELNVYIFNLGTVKAQEAQLLHESQRDLAFVKYGEALSDYNISMQIDINMNLQRLPIHADKLIQRSDLYHRIGNYDESQADIEAAIKLREEIFGKDHTKVIETYFHLADLLYKRYKNSQQGTSESRKSYLLMAFKNCLRMEEQIRRAGDDSKNYEDILKLYTEIVSKIKNKREKDRVQGFCNDVRSGRLFHSDSTEPEESSNGSSTSSSSNSMDATLAQDLRDSGIAESVSTQDDMDLSFNSLSFRQTSTESEVDSVFLTMSGDHDIHTDTRQSLKRHHSSDSDN